MVFLSTAVRQYKQSLTLTSSGLVYLISGRAAAELEDRCQRFRVLSATILSRCPQHIMTATTDFNGDECSRTKHSCLGIF